MSHFTLMVVKEGFSLDDELEAELAEEMEPFNEQPDGQSPYLEFEDQTEEVLADWGKLEGVGNVRCYRTTRTVDGKEEVETIRYQGLDDFAERHFGCIVKSTPEGKRYGYMTNPNSKWDWYTIGGRWTGVLKLKEKKLDLSLPIDLMGFKFDDLNRIFEAMKQGPVKTGRTLEDLDKSKRDYKEKVAALTEQAIINYVGDGENVGAALEEAVRRMARAGMCPPFMTGQPSWGNTSACVGYADIVRKEDVDIEGMEEPQKAAAERIWDGFHEKRDSLEGKSYADLFATCPKPSAETPFSAFFKTLPEEFRKWDDENLGFVGYEERKMLIDMGREEYVACRSIWHTFAVLWNGRWYEEGRMGWWAISTNNEKQWSGVFKQLWSEIPDDALLILVDCHI